MAGPISAFNVLKDCMKRIDQGRQRISEIFRARDVLTVVVLALALLVTYKLWDVARQNAQLTLQGAFEFRVREANERIEQRIALYEQVLRATVGLFVATGTVNRAQFRSFVSALRLDGSYPGIHGIGFSVLIPPQEKARHETAVRAEGFPDYRITPPEERDIYTAIVYLEPFWGSNLRAFGFDMYSEPKRRAAMAYARDTGKTGVSASVVLVQEGGKDVQAGFLMYLPVYRPGTLHDTLEERRASLAGWVYAPFRMTDFMHGIYGEQGGDLDIEIYDADRIAGSTRMHDSEPSISATESGRALMSINRIAVGNRIWTVATKALPAFEMRMQSDRPQLILQAGISISLMIALLIWLFLDDRAHALQTADQALQLALYDALTGLPNRKLLDERLKVALSKAQRDQCRVALLFIDLDKFKPVNDNYGHAYGDLLLKEVAKRLRACMRESDTASRLGGDEFVALLPDIGSRADVATVAEKILQQLTQPYEISGHTFHISASIGAAVYPEDGADGKALTKSADMAMYAAKNSGRANVKFASQPS